LERARHHEVSLSHRIGKNNMQVAFYSDRVRNTVLTGVGMATAEGGELLPDVDSGTFSYQGTNLDTNGVRVVLQRVSRAEVRVAGRVTGKIGVGFLVLAGFAPSDTEETLAWMADKIIGLRLFGDAEGKMNLALADVRGALLVVSQFTLYGDVKKGRRPSFIDAAMPDVAIPLYDRFVALLRERGAPSGTAVATGEFGAMMDVELVNDGPVTLLLER
jgi:D-tyrosyl-tRNA(Tyr) deacylase